MAYSVGLTNSTRDNLLSLQNTAGLSSTNQARLSSGKSVNSALDDPVKFFNAQALNDRASALTNLLGGMSNGIQMIQMASKSLDTISTFVKSMQAVVQQAQTSAAQNLPKISSGALATAAVAATAGKSIRDTTLGMTVLTAPVPPPAGPRPTNGNIGVPVTANTLQLSAGNETYTYTIQAKDTVADIVSQINRSGIATANIDNQGVMQVTGEGSEPLSINLGAAAVPPASGFTPAAAATTRLFGARSNAVVGGLTSAARSALVEQFNGLRTQVDAAAKDAGFNGVNLLNGDKTTIIFNELTGQAQAKLLVQGTITNSTNLGLGTMQDSAVAGTGSNFSVQNNSDLDKASAALTNALNTLSTQQNVLSSNMSIIQTRQDFTKNMTNILKTGASNLTAADMNEEAANSQALQIRQSVGISSLSLANQANQGVLQLLR